MKKSVIIVISLVFIMSVVLVNFFGLNHQVFNETVYVSEVHFTGENITTDTNGIKQIVLRPDENGVRQYQLKYTVTPENASNPTVSFNYDDKNGLVHVSETGLVTFQRAGVVIITIKPNDLSDCSDTLKIIFR
ncbi:MAG: hypothetical protein IKY62_01850 [Clostridia bacterium]|nr:hypothetical protein [Clostridia bacterium]